MKSLWAKLSTRPLSSYDYRTIAINLSRSALSYTRLALFLSVAVPAIVLVLAGYFIFLNDRWRNALDGLTNEPEPNGRPL